MEAHTIPNLKDQIYYFLKKHHQGKDRAITVRELCNEFRQLKATERDVRQALRELDLEGKPVISTVQTPYGFYFATTQDELDEYRANLVSRLTSLRQRIEAIEKMRLEPTQMRFDGFTAPDSL